MKLAMQLSKSMMEQEEEEMAAVMQGHSNQNPSLVFVFKVIYE